MINFLKSLQKIYSSVRKTEFHIFKNFKSTFENFKEINSKAYLRTRDILDGHPSDMTQPLSAVAKVQSQMLRESCILVY